MKYCMRCGEKLEDDDIFCGNCGTRQPQIIESETKQIMPSSANRAMNDRVKLVRPEDFQGEALRDEGRARSFERMQYDPADAVYLKDEPEEAASGFNACRFFKTLLLVILPVISIVMLFLGWVSFKGASSGNVNAIISSCAGHTDNRVVSSLSDGSMAPIELPKMADSVASIATFLSTGEDMGSINIVVNIFRVAGLAVLVSIAFGVISIIFRAIRPLKKVRNIDFAFFFLQLLLFVFFLFMSIKLNSYIETFNMQGNMFGIDMDLSLAITPWSIIALICSVPSCILELIKFPGEEKEYALRRSPLPFITAAGSVLLVITILAATAFIYFGKTQAGAIKIPDESQISQTRPFSAQEITTEDVSAPQQTEQIPPQTAEQTAPQITEQTTPQITEQTTPEMSAEAVDQEFASTIRRHLPIVTYASPASGAADVYAYSDQNLRYIDNSSYISCYDDEILVMDISADGRAVQVKYGTFNGSYKTKWFATEDILGICSVSKSYIAARDADSYIITAGNNLKVQGYIGVGEDGIVIGERSFAGIVYESTIYPIEAHEVNGVLNVAYRIAWIRQGSYN